MYKEWFEKIAKSLDITEVIDNDKKVTIILSKENSSKIKGDNLFLESYKLSKNFSLDYKNNRIHIILDKNNLEKHYLMYLIAILIKIRDMIKK